MRADQTDARASDRTDPTLGRDRSKPMSRDYWGVWLLAAIIVAIAVNPLRVRLVREWLKRHKRPLKYADLRVHVEGADDPGQPRDPGKYEGRDQPRPQPGDRRFSAYFNSIVELALELAATSLCAGSRGRILSM